MSWYEGGAASYNSNQISLIDHDHRLNVVGEHKKHGLSRMGEYCTVITV